MLNQPVQTSCKILKRFEGQWFKKCGYLDGQKFVCMEKLYEAIQNDSCLVYSFGLADDWDFEVTLAHLGNYHTFVIITCRSYFFFNIPKIFCEFQDVQFEHLTLPQALSVP